MLRLIDQFSLLNAALYSELKKAVEAINLNAEKNKQRKQLLKLDDRMLKDIGVTREQAIEEVFKNKL